MLTGLLHAHSGLRYLALLAGAVALVFALIGILGKRPYSRGMRISGSAFAGLLHLQVLLGLALVVGGLYSTAVLHHLLLMVGAAVAAQLPVSIVRRRPETERTYPPHLAGTVVALLLIWGGVAVIGRGLLGSAIS